MALQRLQQLSLGPYTLAPEAAATAPAWAQLRQLRKLTLAYGEGINRAQQAAILAAVRACIGLTRLALEVPGDILEPYADFVGVAACTTLVGLARLHDLAIVNTYALAPSDAQVLSTLTRLTRLVLAEAHAGLDDVAATALA
ncbi:hypothetical protein COO60DRAFT_1644587 [Scenedesmus sp. NREL 46B-D3]|nr:hypothetical protein COO60DRAFT_1644587 [Scenedesmus sp. NREL 46B-D3]